MMEPLHLTEENCRDLQELVRLITPDFEAEVWAQVRIDRETELARRREQANQWQQQMNAAANQSLAAVTRRAFTPQMAANIHNSSPLFNQLLRNATASSPPPIYQSVGTGFTPYGPLPPGLHGPVPPGLGWDLAALDKALP